MSTSLSELKTIVVPDLTGRTVLVTGAGRGIGAELVRQLTGAGARVFAGIHRADLTEALPREVVQLDLDVTSDAQVREALRAVADGGGELDALVNNAGVIAPIGHFASLASEALAQVFAVNVAGAHRVTLAALPLLRKRRGVVINAGTGAATTPLEGWTAYCTTKAALLMWTRMLAMELAGDGVQAFFIGIPPTDTGMQAAIRQSGLNPVSRIPQGDLVATSISASALAWLCSPDARRLEDVSLDVRTEPFRSLMTS